MKAPHIKQHSSTKQACLLTSVLKHAKINIVLLFLMACCLSKSEAQEAVRPASTINPVENQARINLINQGLPNALKEGTMTAGMIEFLTPEEFVSEKGCVTLDFEPSSGFSTSNITVSEEGTVWREIWNKLGASEIVESSIQTLYIKGMTWLRKLDISWCSLDPETRSLSETDANWRRVYLVKDRDAGDIVSSGTQGLIVLPAFLDGSGDPTNHVAGVLFKPNVAFSGFACVLNSGQGDYSAQVVAYGENDKFLFSYIAYTSKQGHPIYVGFQTKSNEIHSVWVSQMCGADGTTIDDVSFLKK